MLKDTKNLLGGYAQNRINDTLFSRKIQEENALCEIFFMAYKRKAAQLIVVLL